jgi:8-oxo-dGTP pyrophosphatase MutT (NUDIX family)
VIKEIDKLGWLYIQNGKLLVARSKNKSLFYIPGGKREKGESDQQALIREINEEISVNLLTKTIVPAAVFTAQADGEKSDITVKLTCYYANYEGELVANAEIETIEFMSYCDKQRCSTGAIQVMDWLYSQHLIK